MSADRGAGVDTALLVLVDGSNVAHAARWVERVDDSVASAGARLVDRCASAAGAAGWQVFVTFDGVGPFDAIGERVVSERCRVVATGRASADTVLEREASIATDARRRHWLVTSDRALRDVAGGGAERVLGARAFLDELAVYTGRAHAGTVAHDDAAPGSHDQGASHLRDRIGADVRALLERLRRGG